MKTVTGKVTSSSSISLSKAAKYLSQFVSAENGVPPSIHVYLQRASESFNELVQLHREVESKSASKKLKFEASEVFEGDGGDRKPNVESVELSQQPAVPSNGEDSKGKKKKKKKKKNKEKGGKFEENGRVSHVVDADIGNNAESSDGKKHKKKKKKKDKALSSITVESQVSSGIDGNVKQEVEERGVDGSVEPHSKKKKKNKGGSTDGVKVEGEREGEASMAMEEVKKEESKKRKIEEMEGRDLDNSEEPKNKKKRRKNN